MSEYVPFAAAVQCTADIELIYISLICTELCDFNTQIFII